MQNSRTLKCLQYFGQRKNYAAELRCSPAVSGIHVKEETWVAFPLLMKVSVLHVKHLLT